MRAQQNSYDEEKQKPIHGYLEVVIAHVSNC